MAAFSNDMWKLSHSCGTVPALCPAHSALLHHIFMHACYMSGMHYMACEQIHHMIMHACYMSDMHFMAYKQSHHIFMHVHYMSDMHVRRFMTAVYLNPQVPVGALDAFRALMAEFYLPILSEEGSWGPSTDQHSHAFLKVSHTCNVAISDILG